MNYQVLGSKLGFAADSIRQFRLIRRYTATLPGILPKAIGRMDSDRETITNLLDESFSGQRLLEIGHGQQPTFRCGYFAAQGCRVTGIDLDDAPRGFSPLAYFRVLRRSGFRRALKTATKEMLGYNRVFRQEFCTALGLTSYPVFDLRRMDACRRLALPDASFDVAVSYDVFEHLPDPEVTLQELARVLRPGGVALLYFVHYGWFNALHDMRLLSRGKSPLPLWLHLRPSQADQVKPGAYVNNLRIHDWRLLIEQTLPGAQIHCRPLSHPQAEEELAAVRRAGECADYSDEELLTDRLQVLWRRPAAGP